MKYYPTPQHEKAAEKVVEIFSRDKRVKTILLFASCARGKACKDSCLDIWLFVDKKDVKAVERKFKQVYDKHDVFKELQGVGEYSHIDWVVTDGKVEPGEHGWETGPDEYEIGIGNLFVYSAVLFDRDGYFRRQKKKCVPYYSEALRINPMHVMAHNNLGIVLINQGRLDDAIRHFSEALRMNPGNAGTLNNLGMALRNQGKINEAIKHFSEALRINPEYAEVHNRLGFALAKHGKMEEAINHFSEALRISPEYAGAHNNMGYALERQGRTEEAIDHYSQALQINPRFAEAHNNLAIALMHKEKIQDAIVHFREALRIKPGLAHVRNSLKKALTLQQK